MDLVELAVPGVVGPVSDAAQRIAHQAHQGQLDKAGAAYIEHPARVASRLAARGYADEVVAAGWLHDVLEDTDWSAACLAAAGISEDTLRIVVAMTRLPNQPGSQYYAGIVAAGPTAVAVKEADIDDNTDPRRTALLEPDVCERLAKKYAKARLLLGVHQLGACPTRRWNGNSSEATVPSPVVSSPAISSTATSNGNSTPEALSASIAHSAVTHPPLLSTVPRPKVWPSRRVPENGSSVQSARSTIGTTS